jgi:thymidylate synthase
MEQVHESLHNELNYLAMINSLLENHVDRSHDDGNSIAGLGVQVGFDLGKSFPSLTCHPVDVEEMAERAIMFMKANKRAIAALRTQLAGNPDGLSCPITVKHSHVIAVQAIQRGNVMDINVQAGNVDLLNYLPCLMAEMGMFAFMFAAGSGCLAQNLSMQFATICMPKEAMDDARVLLNTEISPPNVISLREGAKLTNIKPADIAITPWADWAAA